MKCWECTGGGGGEGGRGPAVQMSNFLTVDPTVLLNQIVHKIIISGPNAVIFGRLVTW